MQGMVLRNLASLAIASVFGAAMIPGCVIRIGPGDGEETPIDGTGVVESTGGQEGVGDEAHPPEEQAILEALQNADPEEVKMGTAMASYAAVGCASLVESQIADPSTVDEATVEELFIQYAPEVVEQAITWGASVDPSTIPSSGVYPDFSCIKEPYTCPATDICLFKGDLPAYCHVTQCGKESCPWCPWFLDNLIYKAWCVYGCTRDGQYVGAAFRLITRFPKKLGDIVCIPLK
jgi:hypothetical protein